MLSSQALVRGIFARVTRNMAISIFGGGGSAKKPDLDTGLVKETTTQAFAADVLEASRKVPVIVDFWAPWCGPCRQLTPILEKLVKAARGTVRLVKMNIDDYPEVAGQLGVQSIPAVFAFKNGQPVDGFMGALPESQVRTFIQRLTEPGAGADEAQGLEEAQAVTTPAILAVPRRGMQPFCRATARMWKRLAAFRSATPPRAILHGPSRR